MAVKDREDLVEALRRAESTVEGLRSDLAGVRAAALEELSQAEGGLTVRDIAQRFLISEEALVAFAEAVGELAPNHVSVAAARRAGIVAAAADAWENELGPMLSSAQVRELLGVSRQRVDELLRSQRLIGLRDSAGQRRFPAFQFVDGRPLTAIVAAFWVVAAATVDEWTAASWCSSSDPALDGLSPASWAREGRDPDRLATVARQDAARLAR